MPFRLFKLLLLGILLSSQAAQAAKILGVRSYRAPDYTRLVFDLDAPLKYQIDNKARDKLIIRLKNSTLVVQDFSNLTLANTPIKAITTVVGADREVQLELTMATKVEPRGFTLGKNDQYGDRLVIDLYDLTPKFEPAGEDGDAIGAISASLDKGGKRDIIVAISAGHGGDDPGAIGVGKLQEKEVTLALSKELAAQLGKIPGYKTVLIREDDYYVPLRQRIRLGHDKKADLYLAVHADAADNKNASGATVYALSERGATSEQARRLADKENNADLIGGVGPVNLNTKDAVLASVLLDLSMTASVASSLEIGQRMIRSLDKITKLRRNNVEQASFVELKSADIPSLLVESGYITNADDAEKLDSPAWRKQFASAMTEAITHWFNERPPRGTLISWQKEQGKDELDDVINKVSREQNSVKNAEAQSVIAAPRKAQTYKVKAGDSLSEVAQKFSVSMLDIRSTNKLKGDTIRPGQILKIPAS